jgi:hypothetical protein
MSEQRMLSLQCQHQQTTINELLVNMKHFYNNSIPVLNVTSSHECTRSWSSAVSTFIILAPDTSGCLRAPATLPLVLITGNWLNLRATLDSLL